MTTSNSKRNEPFRYVFSSPTKCLFQITEINGKPVSTKPAEADIIDISKSGCKLHSELNLNISGNEIKLLINLAVDEQSMRFGGLIRWQKRADQTYAYGVQLELDEEEKDQMLLDIRSLAAMKKIGVL